jgi:hypothetical protein
MRDSASTISVWAASLLRRMAIEKSSNSWCVLEPGQRLGRERGVDDGLWHAHCRNLLG